MRLGVPSGIHISLVLVAAALSLALAGCATREAVLDPAHVAEDAHSGGRALAVSPDSRTGASGGWSGRVRLWQMASGRALARWQTGHGDLVGLMFAPGGRALVSTGRDGFIRIWQVDGRLLDEIDTGLAVTSFAPSEDRRQFLLGHLDGSVSLWTVGGERLGAWKLSHRRITAVAVDAAAGARAAGDKGGRVWRWQGGGPPRMLVSPPTYARTLQFHPADDALYGGGWFDLFRWPVDGDGVEIVPTPHLGILSHIEFSADGSYLASISRQTDSAVMLLDPVSGERLAAYRKHALCGQRVALSPDGRRMISNSDDASVRFYELPQSLD